VINFPVSSECSSELDLPAARRIKERKQAVRSLLIKKKKRIEMGKKNFVAHYDCRRNLGIKLHFQFPAIPRITLKHDSQLECVVKII